MTKKILAICMILSLFGFFAYAAPPQKKAEPGKASAGERIVDETKQAVADVLTGEETPSRPSKGATPPGLEKKGKTPPGWSKGKKTGWSKEAEPKKDSPIRAFIKKLFGKES